MEYTTMKKILFLTALSLVSAAFANDYATFMKEANEAAKAKDIATATAKYTQAYNAAADSKQKYSNVMKHAEFLRDMKKIQEMTELLETELRKDVYNNAMRQHMLWLQATPFMWDKVKYEYALDKLNMALAMDGASKSSILYGKIAHYAAMIHSYHKKDYATVITLLEPLTKLQKSSYMLYQLYPMVANAYLKLGKKEEALKNYQQALIHTKKMNKKTDKIEQKIKELSSEK